MSIRVVANPILLSWTQFQSVQSLSNNEDAHIEIGFNLQNGPFRKVGSQFMLADNLTLTVVPRARVLKTANQTSDLLAHEQGHYNIGILVGRTMARELEQLTAATQPALAKAANATFDLHRVKRMKVVQDDYDTDTNHSQNTTEQTRWNGIIAAGLSAATCDSLDSNDL